MKKFSRLGPRIRAAEQKAVNNKLEIWPQRPRYFSAAITALRGGGGISLWRIDFGPYLVDGRGCGIHGGGGG